jgi:hypothetical protein
MLIIKGEKPPSTESLGSGAKAELARMADLERSVRIAKNRLDNAKRCCSHIVFQKTYKSDVWEHNPDGLSGASCLICKQNFGWACPDSKDGACHYEYEIDEDTKMLTLNDQSKVKPEYEFGGECCVFCGHPEERK